MIHDLTGWHLLNVLAVILLLVGAVEAPTLAQSAGNLARVSRAEIKAMEEEGADVGTPTPSVDVAETCVDRFAATHRRRADATMRPHVRATKRSVVP